MHIAQYKRKSMFLLANWWILKKKWREMLFWYLSGSPFGQWIWTLSRKNSWHLIISTQKQGNQKYELNSKYIYKIKLLTLVEGYPKASFLIAIILRCRGGHYSIPGWLHFTLDPYLIMMSVKQGSIKYHFLSLWIEPWSQLLFDSHGVRVGWLGFMAYQHL